MIMKKVAVALSGGVDSGTAAYLLKKEGWEIEGFTLKFCAKDNRYSDFESIEQARSLCAKIGISHQIIDACRLFQKKVIRYFIKSYQQGLTPNPCVFCNRHIKFGLLFDKIKSLGFTYLATGHYASIIEEAGSLFLSPAKDAGKSQEYFLALIPPAILKNLIFPLADYTKDQVREISRKENLIFKERKESQDVCFINNRTYPQFIEANLESRGQYQGNIRHVSGDILGRHKGIYYFTRGQRSGLGIAWKEPLYVIDIDRESKDVIVGEKDYLYKDEFRVSSLNWFGSIRQNYKDIGVKVRYNSLIYKCDLKLSKTIGIVFLNDKISAVAPGQLAVFYAGNKVLGGGIIQ